MTAPPLDLERLFGTLARHHVRYVIVGGVAVSGHGYVRTTKDLDLVPEPSEENYTALLHALRELGASLATRPGRRVGAIERRFLRRRESLTLTSPAGGIDIVQSLPGVPEYELLRRDAVLAEAFGHRVYLCSLAHLREMKRAAGRHRDLDDLENLPASD